MKVNENIRIQIPNIRRMPLNKTTLFCLPMVGFTEEKISVRVMKYFGFVNCYLEHKESLESYPECLILVFNPSSGAMVKWCQFYSVYKTYNNYVDDYCLDYNLIVLVFRVLPKWAPSLEAFKASKFSQMGNAYMELFKKIDIGSGMIHATEEWHIMARSKEYRRSLEERLDVMIDPEAELMDKLKIEEETFSYPII